MQELYQALARAEQAHMTTSDLEGRAFGVSLAVVADVTDPMLLGRIRVLLSAKGAKTLSDWLVRLTSSKFISVPLVSPGDTVAVAFINGDPAQGVYLGAINNLPQPPAKELASTVSINGDTAIVQTDKTITLVTGSSSLKLTSDGTLDISGVASATINGRKIMVVGGKDSRGDTMTISGQ